MSHTIKKNRTVNDRIIMVKLSCHPVKVNINQVYFPMSEAEDEEIEAS